MFERRELTWEKLNGSTKKKEEAECAFVSNENSKTWAVYLESIWNVLILIGA